MRLLVHAKINWTLAVTGQRPDGYHLLDMLMQSITLSDTLTVDPAETLSLRVSGRVSDLPSDERNLVFRAARLLQEETGCARGAAIHLEKRIPSQAGLGGGSADAAAALWALNRLWGLSLPDSALEALALRLGADVPFCLRGGLCRVGGIGEKLTSLPCAPRWPLVVVRPCAGLSTAEIFRAWHAAPPGPPPQPEAVLAACRAGDASLLPAHPGNDLEAVSIARQPEILAACEALREAGALCGQMSGSGSAVFGVFPDRASAGAACRRLQARWPGAAACETSAVPWEEF